MATAFVADGNSGMQIIDVSNPSISKLISSIKTSGYSSDIALSPSGTIAYVAAGESGLQVIDISDVSNPVPLCNQYL